MIVILGLIILLAAVVVGVAAVVTNSGSAHELTGGFSVFGFEATGSTGTLFLYGIVVGAAALFGLSLLLTGARRTSRRGSTGRHGIRQSRRETAAVGQGRDDLIDQRETPRAETPYAQENHAPQGDRPLDRGSGRRSRPHWFGHRSDPQ